MTPAETDRKAWKQEIASKRCFVCTRDNCRLDIHEILRRSRVRDPFQRWNLTLVCRKCHESYEVACSNRQSMTRMLARKLFWDALHYDLQSFLKARDERAMEFITQAEVEIEFNKLYNQAKNT